MIDLHSHILPGIDDGAKNIAESLELINGEKRQRISSIMLTPHFNFERMDIESFCQKRAQSFNLLTSSQEFADSGVRVKKGAEVFFSVRLNEADLDPLCFEGTSYILIELPTNARPYGLTHTLGNVLNRGYIPILAHVERYPYIAEDPTVLYDLVMRGCLAQVNAGAVIRNSEKSSMAIKYLKWELAQLVCSDCHSMKKRPPNIKEATSIIRKKLGAQYVEWLDKNSVDVYNGRYVDLPVVKKPKKVLGKWF